MLQSVGYRYTQRERERERERGREREVWGVFPSDELIDGLSVCARKFI